MSEENKRKYGRIPDNADANTDPEAMPSINVQILIVSEFRGGLSMQCLAGKNCCRQSTIERVIRKAMRNVIG